MIAQELEVSLHMAFVEARQARYEFITVEHLLLALLDNPSASEVLKACNANIPELKKMLSDFVSDNTPIVPGTAEVDTSRRSDSSVLSSGDHACPVRIERQERGNRRKRSGRHFRRKGFTCRLLPAPAGGYPSGCGQLHFPRREEKCPA